MAHAHEGASPIAWTLSPAIPYVLSIEEAGCQIEGILLMRYLRTCGWSSDNGNRIVSHFAIFKSEVSDIRPCGLYDAILLFQVNSLIRFAPLSCGAGLHLDKYHDAAVLVNSYNIDIPMSTVPVTMTYVPTFTA